jgi:hypothetical protein
MILPVLLRSLLADINRNRWTISSEYARTVPNLAAITFYVKRCPGLALRFSAGTLRDRQKRKSSGAFTNCNKLREFCDKFRMAETGIFSIPDE